MAEKAHPPKYTDETTTEWAILHGAEEFFKQRDEKLRFGLVKRVLQWMLDTDENGWFEKTKDGHAQSPRPRTANGHDDVIVRSGQEEIAGYIRMLRYDVLEGRYDKKPGQLTGEVAALYGYVSQLATLFKEDESLPKDYEKRRLIIQDNLMLQDIRGLPTRRKPWKS